MAFSDEWRDLVDNVDDASAEPINKIAHEVINILFNNTLVGQELLKKENISNKTTDLTKIDNEHYFTSLATSELISERLGEVENNKQNVNIIDDINDEDGYISIKNNTETRCGVINCDNLYIEHHKDTQDDVYNAYVCFTVQGKSPQISYIDVDKLFKTDIRLCGDDVSDKGKLTAVPGTMYEIAFKKVNVDGNGDSIIVGRVGRVM